MSSQRTDGHICVQWLAVMENQAEVHYRENVKEDFQESHLKKNKVVSKRIKLNSMQS